MITATSITVRVPLAIRYRPGRKTVVTPMTDGVAPVTTRADPALVKALARAFRYQRMQEEGRYASISEMAAAERIERGYLGSLLRLTLLAPDIVETILNGRQSYSVTLPSILERLPVAWAEQRKAINNVIGNKASHSKNDNALRNDGALGYQMFEVFPAKAVRQARSFGRDALSSD